MSDIQLNKVKFMLNGGLSETYYAQSVKNNIRYNIELLMKDEYYIPHNEKIHLRYILGYIDKACAACILAQAKFIDKDIESIRMTTSDNINRIFYQQLSPMELDVCDALTLLSPYSPKIKTCKICDVFLHLNNNKK